MIIEEQSVMWNSGKTLKFIVCKLIYDLFVFLAALILVWNATKK